MRAIYFVLFSFTSMYIAVHIRKDSRKWRQVAGVFHLLAWIALAASIPCAIMGI